MVIGRKDAINNMLSTYFVNTFKDMDIPVIIVRDEAGFPIEYANLRAKLTLNPGITIKNIDAALYQPEKLSDLLRFASEQQSENLLSALHEFGKVSSYKAVILPFNSSELEVLFSAHIFRFDEQDYILLSFSENADTKGEGDIGFIFSVFNVSYQMHNVEDAINRVLSVVGNHVDVDRSYIFEEISDTITRNTYEWCAEGVEPAIQDLQNLDRNDYGYDDIINSGVFLTGDIDEIPDEKGREILAVQGIKAIAIMPLYHQGRALGYVGFDDCTKTREWSALEVELLQFIAHVLESLIVRRNAERKVARSLDALQVISDNNSAAIYVNDAKSYDLLFVNQTICNDVGMTHDQLIGQKCWQVLQKDMSGPCPFCPMPNLYDENGEKRKYSWEFQNTITEKWYLAQDDIIQWIDGEQAHIEIATDITSQKEHEEQLKYYASTDIMTGAYNREWGYKIIDAITREAVLRNHPLSLVFIDLDGLKLVNDEFGHNMGDEMILSIINVVRKHIRKNDVLCRWGGDEFLLILRCTVEEAQKIMDNIESEMQRINDIGKKPFFLSFSYGITNLLDEEFPSIDERISHADKLMYQHKLAKRNQLEEQGY